MSPLGCRFNRSTQHSLSWGEDGVFDDTSRIFSRLHCGRANGDFEIAGIGHNTLGFKPQQKE